MNEPTLVEVRQQGEVREIRLPDTRQFDTGQYAELRDELLDCLQDRPRKLLVGFDRIEYCSTAVISALLSVQGRLAAWDGQVRLYGMNEEVRYGFRSLKLDGNVFEIFETREEAAASF